MDVLEAGISAISECQNWLLKANQKFRNKGQKGTSHGQPGSCFHIAHSVYNVHSVHNIHNVYNAHNDKHAHIFNNVNHVHNVSHDYNY